eukprot:m.99312 g.99312  ORF g.99312 m.99312 type:complete len:416 (-) comp27145_c0_seq1:171-1418(-)
MSLVTMSNNAEFKTEAQKYFNLGGAKFTGENSEWTGTLKPGAMRRCATWYGFSVLFKRFNRLAAAAIEPTEPSREHPSPECIACNKVFRLGRGRQSWKVDKVRQPMIAIVCAPSKDFCPIKHTDPIDRRFDCWEIPRPMTGTASEYVVFYVHGGGFVGGDWAGFRGFCEKLHLLFDGAQLFFPNYRMAPEVSIVDQIEDCVQAYIHFITKVQRSSKDKPMPKVIVCGDSCGGNLGLRMLQELARRNKCGDISVAQPYCATFFSPVTDLTCSSDSFKEMALTYLENTKSNGIPIGECTFDPIVIKKTFSCALYGGGTEYQADDPRVSALYAVCEGLPPVYMLASAAEVFADDTRNMCVKLKQANVPHVEDVWPMKPGSVFHSWPVFHKWIPEADLALTNIKDWVQQLPVYRETSQL